LTRKSVVTAVAVLTILGSLTFAGTTMAQTADGKASMITRLSQKLGVPEAQVKSAFDQMHTEHAAEMKANMETKLSALVADGKITEAQKTAILAKMEEFRTKREQSRESFQNLTREERKEKMETEKAELEAWAKSQNIDLSILPFGKFNGMMRMGGHHGGGREM
jgi:cytidylate kinase